MMAFFDALNTFSDSLRNVNQSMGMTLDRIEQESAKKVHNFEVLNKGIGLTHSSIHNFTDTFNTGFSPSIDSTNDLMNDLNKSTKDVFETEGIQNWEDELNKVLDTTTLMKDQYEDFHLEVAKANEDMAGTMDNIATTSSQAVISAWHQKEFAARSFGGAVSTVSDNYTKFLTVAKEGVARADATKIANEELAKTFELGSEQQLLASDAAENAGKASAFLSANLYTVAASAAVATIAIVGFYAITSKAAELQTKMRRALGDTNMSWQQQDLLMGQLAMDAAYTGQSIDTLTDNYAALYSQQLAGANATQDYTRSLNMTTAALGMTGAEAGNLAFKYGKVFKGGVAGFEGVASSVKAAGMQTALTTQEASNLTEQMDKLLFRFKQIPKTAVPAMLAAGAALKETGGDVTELTDKMSDMFDLTNVEGQRLRGLLAGTVAGGFQQVSKSLETADTTQMLSMLRTSLHEVAPTKEQFNSMRSYYATIYGLSEETLTGIYRMTEAQVTQMSVNKQMLAAAQASTKPLTEAFDRSRMSFSNAFQRFSQGFTALLGLLGRPFIAVLTVVFNIFAKISLTIAWFVSLIQRAINWLVKIPVIGIFVTAAVTGLTLAIGALGLAIVGMMSYNLAKYLYDMAGGATKMANMFDGATKAMGLHTVATWSGIKASTFENASFTAKMKLLKLMLPIKIKSALITAETTMLNWLNTTALGANVAALYLQTKALMSSIAVKLKTAMVTVKNTVVEYSYAAAMWVSSKAAMFALAVENDGLRVTLSSIAAKWKNIAAEKMSAISTAFSAKVSSIYYAVKAKGLLLTIKDTAAMIQNTIAEMLSNTSKTTGIALMYGQIKARLINTAIIVKNTAASLENFILSKLMNTQIGVNIATAYLSMKTTAMKTAATLKDTLATQYNTAAMWMSSKALSIGNSIRAIGNAIKAGGIALTLKDSLAKLENIFVERLSTTAIGENVAITYLAMKSTLLNTASLIKENLVLQYNILATKLSNSAKWARVLALTASSKATMINTATTIKDYIASKMHTVYTWLSSKALLSQASLLSSSALATLFKTAATIKSIVVSKLYTLSTTAATFALAAETWSMQASTAAVIANTAAWLSNPIVWIAAAVAAVVLAFKYLGTTLGFVTIGVIALGVAWYASGIGTVISLVVGAVSLLIAGMMYFTKVMGGFGNVAKLAVWPLVLMYKVINMVWDAIWGHSLGTGLLLLIDVFKALVQVISGPILAAFEGLTMVINTASQAVKGLAEIGFSGLVGIGAGLGALGLGFAALGAGMGSAAPGIMLFAIAMAFATPGIILLAMALGLVIGLAMGFANVINTAFQAVKGLAEIGFSGLVGVAGGLAALGAGFAALGFGMGLAAPGVIAFMLAMGVASIFGFGGDGIAGILSGLVQAFDFTGIDLDGAVKNIWLMVEFIKGFTKAMLLMMSASGLALLMTGGLLGGFLSFFGISSPMEELVQRAPLIFGSIRSLSQSLQEQMRGVNLEQAAVQLGMFATIMSSLALGMRDYEQVATMADKHQKFGTVNIEPMMENVSAIKASLGVELATMGNETATEPEVTEAGEDTTTLGDVVAVLGTIQKTLTSYASAHEDDELTSMVNDLGWGGNV